MKKIARLFLSFGLSICSSAWALDKPGDADLTKAMNKYLSEQGYLCVGKFDWPIDVTAEEAQRMTTRDAVQMPVLEKLGLVTASDSKTTRMIDEKAVTLPAKRYALTEKGRKFYLHKQTASLAAGKQIMHDHDLCAGTLALDKIVRWEHADAQTSPDNITVTYTYKITPSAWAKNADAQRVFPMVAQIIRGQGTLQLQQVFHRTQDDWEPVNPWK
jgi:hypothetical protein